LTIDLGPYIHDKDKLRAFHRQSPPDRKGKSSKERSGSRTKKHAHKTSSKREIIDSYLKGHKGMTASAESLDISTT
jgi:hypothetical protein